MKKFCAQFFPVCAALLIFANRSDAITLLVYNNNDTGAGSLRQAVADNLALGGGNTITFSNTVTGTINLLSGQLNLTTNVTILGPGMDLLKISATTNSRIFGITAGAVVSASGLTFGDTKFPSGGNGGAILNSGNLTLNQCTFTNNTGGSLFGAAIYNFTGTVFMASSIVCSNTGFTGGAVVYNEGTMTLVNSTIYGNLGAGVQGNTATTTRLTNCTITANSGNAGGGINVGGTTILRSCTVFNNTGLLSGSAGGVWVSGGSANVGNCIIAGNTAPNNPDCLGTNFTSAGYNLIGRTNGSTGWTALGDQSGTVASPIDPRLGALELNGGVTPTISPLPGSPAIDQGNGGGVAFDQRGQSRPVDFPSVPNATAGNGSDIGAVEFIPAPPQLGIVKSGTNAILFWSTNAFDFRLQSVTNLATPLNWTAVAGTPTQVGAQFLLTNATTVSPKFYRLIFP